MQYYYIHPCRAVTREQMPFTMLGTHKQKSSTTSAGYPFFEYLTLELYDEDGEEYLIWLSLDDTTNGIGRKWILRDSNTDTDYRANLPFDPIEINEIEDDVETQIGNRFTIIYQSRFSRFNLNIDNDADVQITLVSTGIGEGMTMLVNQAEGKFEARLYPPFLHDYE